MNMRNIINLMEAIGHNGGPPMTDSDIPRNGTKTVDVDGRTAFVTFSSGHPWYVQVVVNGGGVGSKTLSPYLKRTIWHKEKNLPLRGLAAKAVVAAGYQPVTELAAPTIGSASGPNGINRKTADRILDPKGYFHPKWPNPKA
jgi:hypothetical protein